MSPPTDSQSLRRERILASPQYRNGAFRNPSGVTSRLEPGTTLPVMREFFFGKGERKPGGPLPTMDPRPDWSNRTETGLRLTWLGHSSIVVEIDGVRLITDPMWAERAAPVSFAGPRRFQPVPIGLDALGAVDAVLISHDHFDHLDRDAVVALARTGARFVAALGVGEHLERWGIEAATITELDWWESTEITAGSGAVRVTAAPAQHFSGRSIGGANQTLWSSFAIRGGTRSFYFGGDTGLMDEHAEIGARLGPFDAVALEIGAHHPAWGGIHLGPDNAMVAYSRLGSGLLLPIHWATFDLAIHPWHEPIERLVELASGVQAPLATPMIGQPFEPARIETHSAWWRPHMKNNAR